MRHAHNKVPDTREINGGNSDGDPPLPIPNREVKPVSADGTAIPSGRVGSRQLTESIQESECSLFFMRLPRSFSLFDFFEIFFPCAACGTNPIVFKIFKRCSGRNSTIGISNGRIIYPATWFAQILFHSLQYFVYIGRKYISYFCMCLSAFVKRILLSICLNAKGEIWDSLNLSNIYFTASEDGCSISSA